jgi:hypothetical protein
MANFRLTTQEAAQHLRTSDSTLRRLRREGVLRAGLHFRAIGFGTIKSTLLWDLDACDEALARRARKELA